MKIDRNIQLLFYYALSAIFVATGVFYFLKYTVDQKSAPVQTSNLNFNTIIQNVGCYKIGNRSSFLNVFTDSNGKVNLNYRAVNPRTPTAYSRVTVPHGFINSNDKWTIYVKNDSEIWLKHGDKVEKWFNADVEFGRIGYDLNDKKRYDKLPKYVIENLLTESETDRIPKAIVELNEGP